jgi:hypothetical protein
MSDNLRLDVLRCIDKLDRMEPFDVYLLMTIGRKDKSGAFTEGCGLTEYQALRLLEICLMTKYPLIAARITLALRIVYPEMVNPVYNCHIEKLRELCSR